MATTTLTGSVIIGNIRISVKSAADHALVLKAVKDKDAKDFDLKAYCTTNKLDFKEL